MIQSRSQKVRSLRLAVVLAVFCAAAVDSAPQNLDTFEIKKSANTSYKYESTDGLSRGYSYAYGDSFASGYKSEQ